MAKSDKIAEPARFKIGFHWKFIGFLVCISFTLTAGIALIMVKILNPSSDYPFWNYIFSSPAEPTNNGDPEFFERDLESFHQFENKLIFITFEIQIFGSKLNEPSINFDILTNREWVSQRFALALINREYQSGAKYLASIPNTTDKNLIVKGNLEITSTMIISILSYDIPGSNNTFADMKWYHVTWNKSQNITCSGIFVVNCKELEQNLIWWRELFGLKSYNETGLFWNFLVGSKIIESEFMEEMRMEGRMENVKEFEENRNIMCRCLSDADADIADQWRRILDGTFNSTQFIEECFEAYDIKKEFRKFFNPPSCYGPKEVVGPYGWLDD